MKTCEVCGINLKEQYDIEWDSYIQLPFCCPECDSVERAVTLTSDSGKINCECNCGYNCQPQIKSKIVSKKSTGFGYRNSGRYCSLKCIKKAAGVE